MNPNWKQIVREHLAVLRLPAEREIEMLSKLRTRLRALLRKSEIERELNEELRYHVERQTEQNG